MRCDKCQTPLPYRSVYRTHDSGIILCDKCIDKGKEISINERRPNITKGYTQEEVEDFNQWRDDNFGGFLDITLLIDDN